MIGLASIAGDPLLRQLLISGRVSDPELERVLTVARRALLDWARGANPSGGELIDFFAVLAEQCFLNEYVFAVSAEELQQLANLQRYMDGKVDAEKQLKKLLSDPQMMKALEERRAEGSSAAPEEKTGDNE